MRLLLIKLYNSFRSNGFFLMLYHCLRYPILRLKTTVIRRKIFSANDENEIFICTGLSCLENGASELVDLINSTYSREYNLKEVPCAFMCAVGPVINHEGRWIGRINSENIKENLNHEAA